MAQTVSVSEKSPLMQQFKKLAAGPTTNFYDLAICLAELHPADTPLMRDLETTSGLHRRKLYYLIQVGRFLRRGGVDKRDAEHIGWTKLQIVAAYVGDDGTMDADGIASCLRDAREMTAKALPDKLRGLPSADGVHSMLLYMTPTQYAQITAALLAFGAERKGKGLVGKEAAMARVAEAAIGKQ